MSHTSPGSSAGTILRPIQRRTEIPEPVVEEQKQEPEPEPVIEETPFFELPLNTDSKSSYSQYEKEYLQDYAPKKKLIALYGSTDGLYTSFGSEYDFLDYHTIITSQLANLDTFKEVIKNNLAKRSRFGTEDDISLSCIYNEELLNEKLDVLKKKVEENKQAAADRKAALLNKKV